MIDEEFWESCTDDNVFIFCTCINLVCKIMKSMREEGISDENILDTMTIFVKRDMEKILSSDNKTETFKSFMSKFVFNGNNTLN